MAELALKLEALNGKDSRRKEAVLSDLAELLNRSGHRGEGSNESFHDSEIADLPDRLPEGVIRLIARRVGPVLLNAHETERLRATAAFVLGKTHVGEGLATIVEAVSAPEPLPFEVSRQCAFAFDALVESCGDTVRGLDLEAVGNHFARHNVPWDATSQRIVVNDL